MAGRRSAPRAGGRAAAGGAGGAGPRVQPVRSPSGKAPECSLLSEEARALEFRFEPAFSVEQLFKPTISQAVQFCLNSVGISSNLFSQRHSFKSRFNNIYC